MERRSCLKLAIATRTKRGVLCRCGNRRRGRYQPREANVAVVAEGYVLFPLAP
jgi:hypothetical protein